ncbi:Transcriptional regulatory protein TcrA [Austwickia sp. TVS 96-490-7B]|uniref:response regulator transcription factor n=1 Tax=Austwickia sp. TVS 96-490-7B TaxID=2830843 RepID=UPI001C596F7F|nr:response regulator transcription factor [Austwickia sp. TVS 96-490-7B]MBW3086736.1 Transcriptional regulatory protein TcrA [Austwickia sp. TVS 96-490-7B]
MRLLLVEDDESLVTMLRAALTKEGFAVTAVGDGVTGLDEACDPDYDVVILDIMVPRRNGYDVLAGMRARQVWTPVMMLTAKDGPYDQVDALDLGADDYLTKPFDLVVLTARLRALLRRGAPERPPVLTVGDLTLDPAEHRVARGGVPIELTAREYALLEYLMRHVEQVVTKPQILAGVWDPAFDGELNVVEVYIGYLRRKIDVPFAKSSIQTVRGVGYRLTAS